MQADVILKEPPPPMDALPLRGARVGGGRGAPSCTPLPSSQHPTNSMDNNLISYTYS